MHTKKEPSIEQIRDFVATMNREKLLSLHQEARLVPAERWAKYSGAELPAAALAALRVQTPTISPDEAAARIRLIGRVTAATTSEQFADLMSGKTDIIPSLPLDPEDAAFLQQEILVLPIAIVGIAATVYTVAINHSYNPER